MRGYETKTLGEAAWKGVTRWVTANDGVCGGGWHRWYHCKHELATKPKLSNWRITCLFSGKGYRDTGVASAALQDALERIKQLGDGRVEICPENIEGRKASPAFPFDGAMWTFERLGFRRSRQI